jgi:hypothetical protein
MARCIRRTSQSFSGRLRQGSIDSSDRRSVSCRRVEGHVRSPRPIRTEVAHARRPRHGPRWRRQAAGIHPTKRLEIRFDLLNHSVSIAKHYLRLFLDCAMSCEIRDSDSQGLLSAPQTDHSPTGGARRQVDGVDLPLVVGYSGGNDELSRRLDGTVRVRGKKDAGLQRSSCGANRH